MWFEVQRCACTTPSVQHPTAQPLLLLVGDPVPKNQLFLLLSPLQKDQHLQYLTSATHPARPPCLLPSTERHKPWGWRPQIPEWKNMAAAAVAQCSPFNLTALATIKRPQGPRWEHTNALGLLIPGAVPWNAV